MVAIAHRVVQLGKESPWGTAVAATAKLMGVTDAAFNEAGTVVNIPLLGTFAPAQHSSLVAHSAAGNISGACSYEDILYLLHGVFGSVTPSGTGPYTWDYSAPLDEDPSPQGYTVEYGCTDALYKVTGGLISRLTIDAAVGDFWKFSADMIGKSLTTLSSLASLSDRDVKVIRAGDVQVYSDVWTGTMGTTELTATLIDWSLAIEAARHLKFFQDGDIVPTSHGGDRWGATLRTKLEFNSSGKALVDALLTPALTQRQIRLKASDGTDVAQIDFAGTLQSGVKLWDDRDGNMVVDLTWIAEYNSQLANYLEVSITNDVETLA